MENNVHVSRAWLDSLSTEELVKIADTYGIDIPPGLERIFIIEEVLECSTTEQKEPENDIVVNPSYSDTVLLPKQYNISFIEVIIRDPLWVFVFWEIKKHDKETYENASDFNGYYLRVVPVKEGETEAKIKEDSFTVSVGADDSARYLGFAEHSGYTSECYIVKLGAICGDNEFLIASSQPFFLPKLNDNEIINDMKNNPLMRLSGVQDMQIILNSDRQSRIKRQ